MPAQILVIDCPCCGAKIELDVGSGVILQHAAPPSKRVPKDLKAAVREVRREESQRERVFNERLAAESRREDQLGKRFASLLERQKGKKPERPQLRDFELD